MKKEEFSKIPKLEELIKKGRIGSVTYDEIEAILPDEFESEQMDDLLVYMESMGVHISDESKDKDALNDLDDLDSSEIEEVDLESNLEEGLEEDLEDDLHDDLDDDDTLPFAAHTPAIEGEEEVSVEYTERLSHEMKGEKFDEYDEETEEEEEEEPAAQEEKSPGSQRLIANRNDGNVDDPVRLYLREIGKVQLLCAEQEVELSKQMECGGKRYQECAPAFGYDYPRIS